MRRFLAAVLAIVMVLSLCTFQVFAAPTTESKYHLRLQDAEEDLKNGTTNVHGTIFSFSSTHGFTNVNAKTFDTQSEGKVTCTKALKIETGTEITFTAPGEGTLYLYFCNPSGNTIKINGQTKTLSADTVQYTTAALEDVTISKGSGDPRLGYIEWVPVGPGVSLTDPADENVQFNISAGTPSPITVRFTVSRFESSEGVAVYAFSSNEEVATVSVERAEEAAGVSLTAGGSSVNGDYILTIKPADELTTEAKANIYVGVGTNKPSTEAEAKAMQGLQTITLTVTNESERDKALKDGTLYMPVLGLTDVSNLGKDAEMILVLHDESDGGKTKAIGRDGNNWLLDIEVKKDGKGNFIVADNSTEKKVALKINEVFSISSGYAGGKLVEQLSNKTFSPKYLTDTSDKPFGDSTSVRIYAGLDGVFYLRGSGGDNEFLGYDGAYKGKFDSADEALEHRVAVEIYIKAPSGSSVPIYYHDYQKSDTIVATQYAEKGKGFRPPVPNDVTIGSETYTLFGWTTDNANIDGVKNLLTGVKYVNVYQFDKGQNKYGLFGLDSETRKGINDLFSTLISYDENSTNSNDKSPRANDFKEQNTTGKSQIDLYPVYVVSGENSTVTVKNANGTASINVHNTSTNATAPRWRGSLTIQIYVDGKMSGEAQTMYFFYNSDNTVDIKLELKDGAGNAIDPETSPFIINAVVAEQSGTSSNNGHGGIQISSNTLSATGGGLDNVIGGTTVKIYMSTRYRAEFYLDGKKIDTGDDIQAVLGSYYSTAENRENFDGNFTDTAADVESTFIVAETADFSSGEYEASVQNVTPANFKDKEYFGADNTSDDVTLEHGGHYLLGYLVQTYAHEFTIPAPTEVVSGGEKLLLGNTIWKLKNGASPAYTDKASGEKIDLGETTDLAFADDGVFRFYAYTAGDLKITKKITNHELVKENQTFTFTIKFDNAASSIKYPDGVYVGYTFLDGTFTKTVTVTVNAGEESGEVTVEGLPSGTYTVTEQVPDKYETETPSSIVTITKDNVGGDPATVSIDNTLKTGSLTINKSVVGFPEGVPSQTYSFTVTGPNGYSQEVTITGAGSKTLSGLVPGTYTVTETGGDIAGYTLSVSGTGDVTVKAGETATAAITNTYSQNPGSLTITKSVTGLAEGVPSQTYTFTVSGPNGYREEVTITGAGSQTITGLVPGEYTVTEEDASVAGYDLNTSYDRTSVMVEPDGTAKVSITNTYTLKTGSLTITKDVEGGVLVDQVFTFTVTPTGGDAIINPDVKGATVNADGKSYTVTIPMNGKATQSVTVTGLPEGTYTVTETVPDNYTVSYSGNAGSAHVVKGDTVTVTVTNTYAIGALLIRKEVTGVTDDTTDFTFTLELTAPDGMTLDPNVAYSYSGSKSGTIKNGGTLTLKAGQYVTVTGIPVGTTYRVTEKEDTGFTLTATGDTGTIGTTTTASAVFTNALNAGSLKITKTITGADGLQVKDQFTFTITPKDVTYTNGIPTVTNATRNADGSYTVTLDYDSAKSENSVTVTGLPVGDYTVTEEVEGDSLYTASVDKSPVKVASGATETVTVTNTVETGSLKVTKTVGFVDDIPDDRRPTGTTFHFTVSFIDFPEGVSQFKIKVGEKDTAGTLVTSSSSGNKVEFDLKADESITLSGIPSGVSYEVSESFSDDFTGLHYEQTWTGQKGSISSGKSAEAACKNTYHLLQEKTGGLRIVKKVNGKASTDDFTFKVVFTDENGNPLAKLGDGTSLDNGVLTFTLGEGETKFIPNIPVGTKYRVEEIFTNTAEEPTDVTVTLTDNEAGDQDHHEDRYVDGTISKEYNIDTLTYTNIYLGELKISKTVVGVGAGDEFTFTVTLPAGTYSYEGAKSGTIASGGQITLKGGESVTIKGIPAGEEWSVTETVSPKYTAAAETISGTIKTGVTDEASFTNTHKTGALTVSKIVTGKLGVEEHRSFNFTVTLTGDGAGLTGTYGDVTFENGVGTFQLKGGEKKQISGLPIGVGYTVQETDGNSGGYITTTPTNATGAITEGGGISVTFINDKPDVGKLTITKVVKNAPDGDADREFEFTITLYLDAEMTQKAENVNGDHGGLNFKNGVATFMLKNGESITAQGEVTVDEGNLYYKIEERAVKNYTASSETTDENGYAEGAVVTGKFTQASANTTVTFTNTYNAPTGTLTVKKEVVGTGTPAADTEFTIKVTLADSKGGPLSGTFGGVAFNEDGETELTLRAGESVELTGIPFGTRYTVEETNCQDAKAINGEVKDAATLEGDVTVTITNTYEKTQQPDPGPTPPEDPPYTPPPTLNTEDHFAYIVGYGADYVRPDGDITRAEIATILFRLLNDETRAKYMATENIFLDVKDTDWFAVAANTMANMGIIFGDENGFRPDDPITRAEMAAMVSRFFNYSTDTAFGGRYSDVNENDWFAGFVHMVSRIGIMQGDGIDTFSPNDYLTRAQAMAVMNRLLGRKLNKRGFLEGMLTWADNADENAWYYADVQEATNSHNCEEVTENGVTYERWTELTENREWTAFEHGIGA